MDTAFAMMGSDIPLRGAESATVQRPFGFANRHFAKIRDSIEKKRTALIPGDGSKRHSFICVDDVASLSRCRCRLADPPAYTPSADPRR